MAPDLTVYVSCILLVLLHSADAEKCSPQYDHHGQAFDSCHDDDPGLMLVQSQHRSKEGSPKSQSDSPLLNQDTGVFSSECPRDFPPVANILGIGSPYKFALLSISSITMDKKLWIGRDKYFVEISSADPELSWTIPRRKNLTLDDKILNVNGHINVPYNTEITVKVKRDGYIWDSEEAQFSYTVGEGTLMETKGHSHSTIDMQIRVGEDMNQYLASYDFRSTSILTIPDNLYFRSMFYMALQGDFIGSFRKLKWLLSMAKGVLVAALHSFIGYDTFLAGYSAQAYAALLGIFPRAHTCDAGNLGTIMSGVEIISINYAKTYSQNLGNQLKSWNWNRGFSLTPVTMRYGWWPEPQNEQIILGYSTMDHGFVRPWLMEIFGPPSQDCIDFIKKEAKSRWSSFREAKKALTGDAKDFGVYTLSYCSLGSAIPNDIRQAFSSSQMATVATYSLNDLPTGIIGRVGGTKEYKERLMKWVTRRLEIMYKKKFLELRDYDKGILASAVVDAFVWAGGLSMGSSMMNAFTYLFSGDGEERNGAGLGADFVFTKNNSMEFIYETIRTLPPVGGFGAWDAYYNIQIWMDMFMLSTDVAAWGNDATSFRLRGLELYKSTSVNWAQQAVVDGNWSAPNSHSCPGYDLSLWIMSEWLMGFQEAAGGLECWQAGLKVKLAMAATSGFVPVGFEMTLKDSCVPATR